MVLKESWVELVRKVVDKGFEKIAINGQREEAVASSKWNLHSSRLLAFEFACFPLEDVTQTAASPGP